MTRKTRLAVIGAGTAGLTAIKQAQHVTDDIVLINEGPLGTTCARVGCMPSKALLAPAHAYARRSFLAQTGVRGTEGLSIDLPAVLAHVRRLRDRFVAGPIRAAQALGDRYISGQARFLGPNTLEVNGERIEAQSIIIATGSRPILPKPWKALGQRVLTSDDIFEQKDLGRRVAVVGLGAIGAELGQALAQLGLQVIGLTRSDTVAGLSDPEVSDALIDSLRNSMQVHTGVDVELQAVGDTGVRVQAGEQHFEVDWVLASLGRRPNLDSLGLEALGVHLDDHGMPDFDRDTLRIGDHSIYIAGDVNAMRPVLHEAADEGRIAAYHALHPDAASVGRRTSLGIVFTEPSAARVGQTHAELKGQDIVVGESLFSDQGRSLIEGRNAGRLRVYLGCSRGHLLGAELVAPDGEHLAHLLAWAIQHKLTIDEILQLPFYHPVIEEGLRSALQSARRALGQRRKTPDLPLCEAPAAWALGGD